MLYPKITAKNMCLFITLINYILVLFVLWVQIKEGFAEGKDLVVSVMCSMGEEQICGLKDIGKN